MSLWEKIAKQFGKPSGLLGNVADYIMATRSSNIERNEWGISLLNLQPSDQVLEIGFGPGIAIQKMSKLVTKGIIYGIDHSDLMVKKASKRNNDTILAGRVKLISTAVSELPAFDKPIDKIIDINSFQFWEEPVNYLNRLKTIMKNEGIIALIHQPRKPGATKQDSIEAGEKFAKYLDQAGFKNIRIENKIMKPVPTIGVLGQLMA
ncbi:MAG: class I SAM-dependent methyltransferase [Desulfobacterales bacterium]|nr:class I SAM-dependent methyltransferase [Desulfobacterales bacterium]